MLTEKIEYSQGGVTFEASVTYDNQTSRILPAVLIFHAWGGRDEFVEEKAAWIAEQGYIGCALDLYGKGVRGSNNDENAALMTPLMEDRSLLCHRMLAGMEAMKQIPLLDQGRFAAIGFCFGGLCALDLARSNAEGLRGVVSFHGLLQAPPKTGLIDAKVLVLHGQEDPMVPPEQVAEFQKEMTEAGADWQLHTYGNTQHAFTNPEANDPGFGTVYHPVAEARSLLATKNFLSEVLVAKEHGAK